VWERGYLARAVGRVRIGAVRKYLDSQAEHHGYASRLRSPVFRYVARGARVTEAAHAAFEAQLSDSRIENRRAVAVANTR